MHFSTWLWEQIEIEGPYLTIANICWDDVNNGCAHAKFDAHKWLKHFNERHTATKEYLVRLLIGAYLAYTEEHGEDRQQSV